MKNHLVVAAIIVSLLSGGCSDDVFDNAVTSPQALSKSDHSANVIVLNSKVKDPTGVGNFIHVGGSVSYKITTPTRWDLNYKALPSVDVSILTKAFLSPMDSDCGWEAGGSSIDRVFLSQNDFGFLIKSYLISGRTDRARLFVKFRVSTKRLEVQDLWVVAKPVREPDEVDF